MSEFIIKKQFPLNCGLITTRFIIGKNKESIREKSLLVDAIWDTGSNMSTISKRVVKLLNLESTGTGHVISPGGDGSINTYDICIMFENGVTRDIVKVSDSPISTCDLLIGMDLISKGRFVLEMSGDHLEFSFDPIY